MSQFQSSRLSKWRSSPCYKASAWTLAAVTAVVVTLVAGYNRPVGARGETTPAPLFTHTQPAGNPAKLVLLADAHKVTGWISGLRDYSGRLAHVVTDGKTHSLPVLDGNVFEWPYKVGKATPARFTFEDFTQTLTLVPEAELAPTVFFVVDRTVYMPGHKLQFAAYLRQLGAAGQWRPLANRAVEVLITGQKKRNLAAKLTLTADAAGRITGSYQWNEADVLDSYDITVPGYSGTAQVTLAEFRKSKIRLKISGQPAGAKLPLVFEALNFLDKPVPGGKIHFTAQVVQKAERSRTFTLNAADFVYPREAAPNLETTALDEDQRLLAEAQPDYFPIGGALPGATGQVPVAQIEGDLHAPAGKATHVMDLKAAWLDGGYEVRVQGVLVDPNGHEQRASQSITLNDKSNALHLSLTRRHFGPDDTIVVTARATDDAGRTITGNTTLVAMRLSPGAPGLDDGAYAGYNGSRIWPRSAAGHSLMHSARPAFRHARIWQPVMAPPAVQRTLVTATAFTGREATLKLAEPGAYKLIAVMQTAGKALRTEIGCIVRDDKEGPALVLNLDKEEYASGEALTGVLHSRFTDARVLLSIRDSAGLKLRQPVQMRGSVLPLNLRLPAGLGYGCTVEAQYVESDLAVHQAEGFIRVVPADRILTIETMTPEVYEPGATAKLKIKVNRDEPVDLVVSVYDQSLLGVAPDKAKDIRNFYLADERGRHEAHRDMLRRKLAGVTVEKLIAHARATLKEAPGEDERQAPEIGQTPEMVQLRQLVQRYDGNVLYEPDVALLLRLAGVNVHSPGAGYRYGYNWNHRINKSDGQETRLFDLLNAPAPNQWRLVYGFRNETLVMVPHHPGYGQFQIARPPRTVTSLGLLHRSGTADYLFSDDRSRFQARGDAWGRGDMASANSSFSVSGQAMLSHLDGAPMQLIDLEANQSGIAVRRDFSDAAFWNARVRTDRSGMATVEFKLPDSLTNWQVVVTAVSKEMHVGQQKSRFRTFKPIMVWPMLPRVFTHGDKVEVFATVHNYSDAPQDIKTSLKVENGQVLSPVEQSVRVPPKENAAVYWTLKAGEAGFTQILMSAHCGAGSDASLKRLPVVSPAVTQLVTASGFCKKDATFTVPSGVDLTTASLEIGLVPSLAADLADTLDYLVEYPYGCVEQTMSRFLPAIKVAQTLKKFKIEHAGLQQKLPRCVEGGIKRLLELQQPDGGWGWQSGSQTHEMMTPYALYGLLEAEKAGYKIGSDGAIARGLNRLQSFINGMGDDQTADRIYCMAVYAHRHAIKDEWWQFIAKQQERGKLSDYALALALEMAVRANKKELAADLAKSLRGAAKKGGGLVWWKTAGFSRWGDDPHEITAAALKALVAHNAADPLIEGILSYFAENKRGNKWNSTKDTAMIVYALCDYLARQESDTRAGKSVTLALNGGEERVVALDAGLMKKVVIPGAGLRAGANTVHFGAVSPGTMYRLVFRYKESGSAIAPHDNGIEVRRRYYLLDEKGKRVREIKRGEAVARGSYLESEVEARNETESAMRYVLVENPKPSSCEILPADDARFRQQGTPYVLREDKTGATVYHHEQTPAQLKDRCILHAELAGDYVVPPAHVEMMYRTQTRGHSGTFQFTVKDRT